MPHRIDDDYDEKTLEVGRDDTQPLLIAGREGDPPTLNNEEISAVLELVSYMPHLDALDFDNMLTHLQLLYLADVSDRNYLAFCRHVKQRFITPRLPQLPPRHQHKEHRVGALDALMKAFTDIPFEEYKAVYARGALPHN